MRSGTLRVRRISAGISAEKRGSRGGCGHGTSSVQVVDRLGGDSGRFRSRSRNRPQVGHEGRLIRGTAQALCALAHAKSWRAATGHAIPVYYSGTPASTLRAVLPVIHPFLEPAILTLDDALCISAAALRVAAENRWKVVIAVVDDGGHLISLQRMDATQKGSVRVAEQKARTAALFKRPTKAFEDAVLQGRPVMMTMPDVICLEGGLPLIRDGVLLGAIGVSGATSAEDGIVAARGAAALDA